MGRFTAVCAAGKVSESKNKSTRIKTWLKCSEQFHEHRNWWSSVSTGFVSCCWLAFSRFLQSLHRVLNTIFYFWYLKLAFPRCQHHLPSHRVYGLRLLFLFWFLLWFTNFFSFQAWFQAFLPSVSIPLASAGLWAAPAPAPAPGPCDQQGQLPKLRNSAKLSPLPNRNDSESSWGSTGTHKVLQKMRLKVKS